MIYLKFSSHIPGAEYFEEAKRLVLDRFKWVEEDNGYWFNKKHVVDFRVDETETFMRIVRGKYGNMRPYNNDPIKAFEVCSQQQCPLFYEGKLHKCSTLGMLDRMLSDHNQIDDPQWAPYLNAGIDIRTASDETIQRYANNYEKPHTKLCKMCPTSEDKDTDIDHIHFVVNKLGKT